MLQVNSNYYLRHKSEILAQFHTHANGWRPLLVAKYGKDFADGILTDCLNWYENLIPEIPYIGGDENPMTRHLVRSTTSLVLYKVMKAHGKSAAEIGKIIYDAVVEAVSQLQTRYTFELSAEYIAKQKLLAINSQERRYPGDWVWEFIEGDGEKYDYGKNFLECGTQKLYHAHDADAFLPFYCYLDFVTHRTIGWGFSRTMTLAEGFHMCDFRWTKGGDTQTGWPPPFIR
jgi:hypothetical protein